jgi:putative membrane protein insertion efficiency factor
MSAFVSTISVFGRAARAGFGLRSVLLLLVRGYRAAISPVLPRSCRFEPSCAAYAEEALRRHNVARALWLVARRILRCHPFHPGGYDPVP